MKKIGNILFPEKSFSAGESENRVGVIRVRKMRFGRMAVKPQPEGAGPVTEKTLDGITNTKRLVMSHPYLFR